MSDPEYVSFANARKVLHQAMVSMGGKMMADQVVKIVGPDGDNVIPLTSIQIKPSPEFIEFARAIEALRKAEIEANDHLMHPPTA